MPDGTIQTIRRKPFIRRSARKDAWRYHLREMALAEEPLRYIRRYLNVDEDLTDVPSTRADSAPPARTRKARSTPRTAAAKSSRKSPRPLPQEPPPFLRRPYP
jgi:hypothetical protein